MQSIRKNTTDKFHQFPRLPAELQREIWRLAVRDLSVPGAHYIDIAWLPEKVHGTFHDSFVKFTSPRCGFRCQGPGYASETPSGYWEHANQSAYLIDYGLWTACWDSRLMMQRKMYPKLYSEWRGKHDKVEEFLEDAVTGLVQDKRRTSPRMVTVFPTSDLFVMDMDQLYSLSISGMDIAVGAQPFHMEELCHIGIEYDPEWGKEMKEVLENTEGRSMPDELQQIIALAMRGPTNAGIYIIDYHFKCHEAVKAWEEQTKTSLTMFYTSEGRFIRFPRELQRSYINYDRNFADSVLTDSELADKEPVENEPVDNELVDNEPVDNKEHDGSSPDWACSRGNCDESEVSHICWERWGSPNFLYLVDFMEDMLQFEAGLVRLQEFTPISSLLWLPN